MKKITHTFKPGTMEKLGLAVKLPKTKGKTINDRDEYIITEDEILEIEKEEERYWKNQPISVPTISGGKVSPR